jgi:hypothetical protein
MIDKYEEIFDRYKKFIEENSKYNTRVVKHNTNTSTYFPIVCCVLSNNIDTDHATNDKIEYYEGFYFTIDIFTKDKTIDGQKVASQVISDELTKLTIHFFGELNMKRTLNRPTPNLDTSILRRTLQYQCLIGNVRGNIIRR